jgi:hypothetical protein
VKRKRHGCYSIRPTSAEARVKAKETDSRPGAIARTAYGEMPAAGGAAPGASIPVFFLCNGNLEIASPNFTGEKRPPKWAAA